MRRKWLVEIQPVFLFCLTVPGTPAAMPLEDVRTHETVHIEVGDCLIDVDGLKQT